MIICYTVPEIWSVTDVLNIFCPFIPPPIPFPANVSKLCVLPDIKGESNLKSGYQKHDFWVVYYL